RRAGDHAEDGSRHDHGKRRSRAVAELHHRIVSEPAGVIAMGDRKIFVNFPVKDLKKSMSFYEAIGFKNNPQFTDNTAACMVVSEEIYVMIFTHEKFKGFT